MLRTAAPVRVGVATAPIWRQGGKHALAHTITGLFPAHEVFIDLFGGAGHITFTKPRAALDVYNDLDTGLVNFMRVVRDPEQHARLVAALDFTPYARAEWQYCRAHWRACADPVEQARMWFVVCMQGFAGPFGKAWGFVTSPGGSVVEKYRNATERIAWFSQQMRAVQIENLDWRKCLSYYDKPGKDHRVLVYADPPYMAETRRDGAYEHEMNRQDHSDLLSELQERDLMAVLSGYDNPLHDLLLVRRWGWQKFAYSVTASMVARTAQSGYKGKGKVSAQQQRTECVWVKPNTMIQMELWR